MEETLNDPIMTEQPAAPGAGRPITVIAPREAGREPGSRFEEVLESALDGRGWRRVEKEEELQALLTKRDTQGAGEPEGEPLLFALSLGETGINLEYIRMLRFFREHTRALEGCVGGVLVDGRSDLYTKSVARELVFTANRAGCAFVGRPLVEGTKTLSNFSIVARNMDTDLMSAYKKSAAILTDEILDFRRPVSERPSLLVLHASSHPNSNTFALWEELKRFLPDFEITEIGLRNGTVSDCSGCPYKMCLHFGENESCFYGGVMVEDVYPAVKRADAVLMLCPNYNDALSANLTAFINRLTALFRIIRFYDKALFAIVVSGYSGSDIVAEQLIAALNMNKTFYLPARFALMETANAPGAAMRLPGIHERLRAFAAHMRRTLTVRDLCSDAGLKPRSQTAQKSAGPPDARKETDRCARKIL